MRYDTSEFREADCQQMSSRAAGLNTQPVFSRRCPRANKNVALFTLCSTHDDEKRKQREERIQQTHGACCHAFAHVTSFAPSPIAFILSP